MGHIRLGTLPKTQKWDHVVSLIAGGADVERIAAASADAAEHGLERAAAGRGVCTCLLAVDANPAGRPTSEFFRTIVGTGPHRFEASRRFWRLLQRSRAPSIAMSAKAANAAISARWHSLPPPKP